MDSRAAGGYTVAKAVIKVLYEGTVLRQSLSIRKLYTIHYYEYDSQYSFEGEAHDFWELVYVDLGSALITQGAESFRVDQGYGLIHPPGVFHRLSSQGGRGLNLCVLSFACPGRALMPLTRTPFVIGSAEKQILSAILTHARSAFSSDLDAAYFKLRRRETAPLGSEQLIRLNLEMLLLQLLRRHHDLSWLSGSEKGGAQGPAQQDQLAQAVALMQANLQDPLSVEELCRRTLLSRSKLQRLFRLQTGMGVTAYYIKLRIEAAKTLMRNNLYNFSEIAEMLGFPSIHYFSRQFKQVAGMTPTEYCASLRMLTENKSC